MSILQITYLIRTITVNDDEQLPFTIITQTNTITYGDSRRVTSQYVFLLLLFKCSTNVYLGWTYVYDSVTWRRAVWALKRAGLIGVEKAGDEGRRRQDRA